MAALTERERKRNRAAPAPVMRASDWFGHVVRVEPSGLRMIVEPLDHVRSVSVGVYVATGSRHEPEPLAGLTHFLEHLFFKGTETRSAREIAEAIDAVGGVLNAYTSRDYSCYYAKVLDQHLDVALELLSDLLCRPRLDAEDVSRERAVVLEEIKMHEDTPDDLVLDLLAQGMWPGHALGRPIHGSAESVGRLDREAARRWFVSGYTPERAVIAAVGRLDPEETFARLRDAFRGLPGGSRVDDTAPPAFRAGAWWRPKPIEQIHLALGTPGVGLEDDELYAEHVLATVLGGGTSSRLFQEIREARGLAYSVFASPSNYRGAGLFTVYAATGPERSREVLALIVDLMRGLREDGPEPQELERAKEQLKASILMALESTGARMGRLGRSLLLLGQVEDPDAIIEKIDRVSADDLVRLARRTWRGDLAGVAGVGPIADAAALEREVCRL